MRLSTMRFFVMFFFSFTATVAFSQIKKPISKPKVDETEVIKTKVLKLFKEQYVEQTFKDPYSYKPLKTTVYPVTLEMKLLEDTLVIYDEIKLLILKADTTKGSVSLYKGFIEDCQKREYKDLCDQYRTKLADARKDAYEAQQLIDFKKNQIDEIIRHVNSMTIQQKNSIGYYLILHDCYGNNSYGNPILGRYSMKYTTEAGLYDILKKENE